RSRRWRRRCDWRHSRGGAGVGACRRCGLGLPRDAYAHAAALDLDLGEGVRFQKRRELAHHVGIDAGRSLALHVLRQAAAEVLALALAHLPLPALEPTRSAIASIASR